MTVLNIIVIICLLILDVVIAILLFKQLFKRKDTFIESLYYAVKPGWLSIIHGDYWEDIDATKRVLFFNCSNFFGYYRTNNLKRFWVGSSIVNYLRVIKPWLTKNKTNACRCIANFNFMLLLSPFKSLHH